MLDPIRIKCTLAGALILFDAATRLDERLLSALGIAADPEGTSDITADFPDEEWKDVWQRETAPVMEACRSGELLVDLIDRGAFFVRVGVDASVSAKPWMSERGFLVVQSGRIAVAEAGDLASAVMLGGGPEQLHELKIPPGTYRVDISHVLPADPENVVMGSFWSPDEPAIVIRLSRAHPGTSRSETPNFFRFPKAAIASLLEKITLYDGVVKKLEDHVAIVSLMVAPDLSSGYAAVNSDGHQLRPGDQVRLRLREKKGGRWSAELVRKLS